MNIGIIDADLLSNTNHRFPNLVSMKLSGYHKEIGDTTHLILSWDDLDGYDKLYLSKVFTATAVPDGVLERPNISYGGTGFFYDKAPPLPDEIEHHMPDYHLYDEFVAAQLQKGVSKTALKFYTDYSIGFLTRGCFRHCDFCVNRNSSCVRKHSPLKEFFDPSRPKICMLDDNFLGSPAWKEMLTELRQTGRRFQFKQGLDERILTDEKCEMLFSSKYDGDVIFAFDNVADKELIQRKLDLIQKYTDRTNTFYCFTGFDREDRWDEAFWKQDLIDLMTRIRILQSYKQHPYIMRFERYVESPWKGTYITLARWCNQPAFFKKKSFREFVFADAKAYKSIIAPVRYYAEAVLDIPELEPFFNAHFGDPL